jgi:hypothetical protein
MLIASLTVFQSRLEEENGISQHYIPAAAILHISSSRAVDVGCILGGRRHETVSTFDLDATIRREIQLKSPLHVTC